METEQPKFRVETLNGVIPALVSPLRQDDSVDRAAAKRLIGHVLDGGVHGVLVLGSTGEGAALAERERRQMVEVAAETIAGRVPLLTGVARMDISEAKADVRAAAAMGACAALVAPPFYSVLDQPAVVDFYRRIADGSPLPILVYNIPTLTKVSVEPATLVTLAREGAIAGTKDSSGNFSYHSRVLAQARDLPGFRVFIGTEYAFLASLLMGSAGTICATSNIAPALCVRLYEAFQQGSLASARQDQFVILELVSAMASVGIVPAFKAALDLMGLCQPWCAAPVQPAGEAQRNQLRAVLERCGLLPTTVPA